MEWFADDFSGNRQCRSARMRIHFFSTGAVARDLTAGTLSSRLAFGYLTSWLVVETIVAYYDLHSAGPLDWRAILHALIVLTITIVGLFGCYSANGGANGAHFVERFVALALPLTVRTTIGYEIAYWAAYFTYPLFAEPLSDEVYRSVWLGLVFVASAAVTALWFWRMKVWLYRVAASHPAEAFGAVHLS